MTDDDGDGIYTVTVPDLEGVTEYKYGINGFADQENLIDDMVDGATCAPITDFAGYANRQIDAGQTTMDTFGSCDECGAGEVVEDADVTFQVDMNDYSGSRRSCELERFVCGMVRFMD